MTPKTAAPRKVFLKVIREGKLPEGYVTLMATKGTHSLPFLIPMCLSSLPDKDESLSGRIEKLKRSWSPDENVEKGAAEEWNELFNVIFSGESFGQ
jgi:hypothetical protein